VYTYIRGSISASAVNDVALVFFKHPLLLAVIHLLLHSLLIHVSLRMISDVLESLWWFRHLVLVEPSLRNDRCDLLVQC
jgi:hypothetical protein